MAVGRRRSWRRGHAPPTEASASGHHERGGGPPAQRAPVGTAPHRLPFSTRSNQRETARAALGLLGEGVVLSAAVASGAADRAGIDVDVLRTFQLMTTKPIIYVFNMDDAGMSDEARQAELRELVAPAEAVFLDAQFEAELVELEPDEAAELLHENGQEESGLDKLARVGFDTLGLQTYLTAGEKESRAWTIRRGMTAPQAAGVIHTDFERGFIKAEIVSYDDLMEYGSVAEARAHGRVRMEGKDYVMRDGDVVEFRSGLTSGAKK